MKSLDFGFSNLFRSFLGFLVDITAHSLQPGLKLELKKVLKKKNHFFDDVLENFSKFDFRQKYRKFSKLKI